MSWSLARLSSASGTGSFFEAAEFGEGELEDFGGLVDGGAGVDGEGAGVAEGVGLGVDGVGEAAVFADGLEEAASSCRRRAWC